MSESILGLVGVVLGFVLSECSARWRENETERRQAGSIRTMLSLEIDQNLKTLRSFRNEVNQRVKRDTRPEGLGGAYLLVELPLPYWNRRAWEGQISILPRALRAEQIEQVHDFYAQLDNLVSIRRALSGLASKAREDIRSDDVIQRSFSPNDYFEVSWYQDSAKELWRESMRIGDQLLASGNPLRVPPQEQQPKS